MCRWMAYSGAPIQLKLLLLDPKDNLIDQSLSSRSAETPTNGDGFGLGWYSKWDTPGLFRSLRPAWNDFNFRDLASNIESHLFLAHVRATSLATVQETNCHPFRYQKWLFVHNGEVFDIDKFRKELIMEISPGFINNIQGTTDSELMFHLALTFGLQDDVIGAVTKMAGFVEAAAKRHQVDEALWMTLGISDGKTLYAFRYASDGKAPTLYYSPESEVLHKLNPDLEKLFGTNSRAVVSEPIGKFKEWWPMVPENSVVIIRDGKVEVKPFKPAL